jgi:hypothetical protein
MKRIAIFLLILCAFGFTWIGVQNERQAKQQTVPPAPVLDSHIRSVFQDAKKMPKAIFGSVPATFTSVNLTAKSLLQLTKKLKFRKIGCLNQVIYGLEQAEVFGDIAKRNCLIILLKQTTKPNNLHTRLVLAVFTPF